MNVVNKNPGDFASALPGSRNSAVDLLQRRVHSDESNDARDQVLAIFSFEEVCAMHASRVEMEFFWLLRILEDLQRVIDIGIILAAHEQLGRGDRHDLLRSWS